MRQRWLFITTLFLLSLGLGSLSLLTTPDEPQPIKKPRLTTLDPKQVQTIRIERFNKDTIVFQKDAQGTWQIREPYQLPANRFRVENILTLLTSSQYSPLTGDNINLAELKQGIELPFYYTIAPNGLFLTKPL
ncbi:hypothetical protein [Beggiatoa alba]|uniref:hypothetical protein n=1 Tax=Beggiatoa alba TaxID=1022 RepID=UPI0002F53ED0|nr:hypothetical protein [Beggiatoa alba]